MVRLAPEVSSCQPLVAQSHVASKRIPPSKAPFLYSVGSHVCLQPPKEGLSVQSVTVLIAWALSLIATLGSLFFSEVMKLPPCVLCWYQRICMYPLVFILATGWIRRDPKAAIYALPLTLTCFVIAVYHNLLYYHVIPESIAPCTQGVSCTSRQIEWAGFITIPLLSLVAFTVINGLLISQITKRRSS